MADFTSTFPNLHVHGVARFRDGKFSTSDPKVVEDLRGSKYASEVVADPDVFDPSAYGVDDVHEHLQASDDAERSRVLEAEAAGKGRVTIASWVPEG